MNLSIPEEKIRGLIEQAENVGADDLRDQLLSIVYPRQIVNLTSHDITILDQYNNVVKVIPVEPDITCRVSTSTCDSEIIDGVEVVSRRLDGINGLPEPKYNTYYVVSALCATYAPQDRDDLLVVCNHVRDESGRVIGCRRLERV